MNSKAVYRVRLSVKKIKTGKLKEIIRQSEKILSQIVLKNVFFFKTK